MVQIPVTEHSYSFDAIQKDLADLAATVAPSGQITRSQIPTKTLGTGTIRVSGYTTPGDLGAGADYTSQGATSGSPMAIQDAVGTWYQLVITDRVHAGWFGALGAGGDYTTALQGAMAAANTAVVPCDIGGGNYKITAPINIVSGTLRGVGTWSGVGAVTYIHAATAGMTMMKLTGGAGRLQGVVLDGDIGNLGLTFASIGLFVDQNARYRVEDVDIYSCSKAGLALSTTQNSTFLKVYVNLCSYAIVLANGARNNSFFNCNTGNWNANYKITSTTYANTIAILFLINTGDADYNQPVTAGGNDRNNFFGGIYEGSGFALGFQNISNMGAGQNGVNCFFGDEFDALTILTVASSPQANMGTVVLHTNYFGWQDQVTPFSVGTTGNGRLTFQGEPAFSGGNTLQNRGITVDSNFSSLFVIDTDNYFNPATDIYGSGTWSAANKEFSLTGTNTNFFGLNPPLRNGIATNGGTLVGPLSAILTITLKTAASGILVYLNNSSARRLIATITVAGTSSIPIHIGGVDNPNDIFALQICNNSAGSTSTVFKGIQLRTASGV
jgi:hypothetical protein